MGKSATKSEPAVEPALEIRVKVTMGSNGRIVIPAEVREALGLDEGQSFTLVASEAGLRLATPMMALKSLQNLMAPYKKPGESVVDEFIREKRAEAARE